MKIKKLLARAPISYNCTNEGIGCGQILASHCFLDFRRSPKKSPCSHLWIQILFSIFTFQT